MDIISYLLELIETRKNVGITALGTLYVKKIPGRYDVDAHAFLPPKHEISFTPEVREGVELVNFISEKRSISLELATRDINEFVSNIKAQLAENQYADLSPLGTFKLINDQIVFEGSEKFQVGFDFYGLPEIPTVEEERLQNDAEISSAPLPLTDPVWRPTVDDRYGYDDDDDENKGRGKRIFLKTLLILFIIAIAGAAVYFFYPNILNSFLDNHQDQQIENASVVTIDTNSIEPVDSAFADSVKKTINFTKPADTLKSSPIIASTSYEVIGSAMKSKKKVEEIIGNLAKRGIKAKAIDALPGRLIKISLGTFTNYDLAKKFQDSLKVKLKNPEIYIQTIKPKN